MVKRYHCFNPSYYLMTYDDVRLADLDPLDHFLKIGWREGRNPSGEFDTKKYLNDHPEIIEKNINPLIHFLQQREQRIREQRPTLFEALRFFIKGIRFFIKLHGVVFFAGYPYPEREKDGYYQRIRSIDTLFTDRWRVYIDSVNLPGKDTWYDFPASKTLVLRPQIEGYKNIARLCSVLCIVRSRVTYFHSILSTGGIEKSKLFWRYPFITRILDLHGVVPEEFDLQGDKFLAQYFHGVEKLFIKSVDYLIVVTKAMRVHIEEKYPRLFQGHFIILPIFQKERVEPSTKPDANEKPVIVYAGGLQKWQQVPKMIDAIQKTANQYQYRIYCPEPETIISMLSQELWNSHSIIVESKKPSELISEYSKCQYGFILRENTLVNQVACPTKLIEYLAMGIVPIVDSEKIGDFLDLGMKYIYLDDLLEHNLPNESLREEMVSSNYKVYQELINIHKIGINDLQRAIK